VQESAQFLAGEALPLSLLTSLLAKTPVTANDTCILMNLTAYDCWVERVAKKWKDVGTPAVNFKTMSLSKQTSTAQYVEKALALELMQDNVFSKSEQNCLPPLSSSWVHIVSNNN